MTKKNKQKTPTTKASQAATTVDVTQLQALLGQFHAIARSLHKNENQEQVEATLTPITSMPEATQIALLKALAKEQTIDAADVVLALNEFSPHKEVRKEARRSLIRLQEVNVYPQWQAPVKRTALVTMLEEAQAAINPPRFWKGVVTKSRDVGEVSLILLWEQGENYREVRLMGFLLEFWTEGVKDFFTEIQSKRSIERFVSEMTAQVETVACDLAQGRDLIRDALAVHKKFGTKPYRDFQKNEALIHKMILDVPDLGEAEELDLDGHNVGTDSAVIAPDTTLGAIVTGFIEAEVERNFKLAYAHLAKDSELSEGLAAQEWISRRQQWAAEAQPDALMPGFIEVVESRKPKLWLPNPLSRSKTDDHKEIEVSWSIMLNTDATQLQLPELPRATAFYKENQRYWFWAIFSLVKEEEGWRIQNISDEGTNVQTLSINELQARIKEEDKQLSDITKKHAPTDPDALKYLGEVMRHAMKAIYYDDALITKLPLDETLYMDAASRSLMLGEHERSLSYLERVAELFPAHKAEKLREIAAIQVEMSEAYYELEAEDFDDDEDEDEDEDDNVVDSEPSHSDHFLELAKASLKESLSIEDNAIAHIILADLVIESSADNEELDEAEDHLLQAQSLTEDPSQLAHIENSLAEIDLDREQYEHALRHFEQVLETDESFPDIWYNIGKTHQVLGNEEECVRAFNKAIELDPTDEKNYSALGEVYVKDGRVAQARAAVERGLQAIPDSPTLLVMLSTTYFTEDPHHAEDLLEKAESLAPGLEIVTAYRELFDSVKQSSTGSRQQGKQIHGKKPKKR